MLPNIPAHASEFQLRAAFESELLLIAVASSPTAALANPPKLRVTGPEPSSDTGEQSVGNGFDLQPTPYCHRRNWPP